MSLWLLMKILEIQVGSALAVIDSAQVEHLALDDFPAAHALVFDDAPVVVRLAILEAFAAAQKHDGSG